MLEKRCLLCDVRKNMPFDWWSHGFGKKNQWWIRKHPNPHWFIWFGKPEVHARTQPWNVEKKKKRTTFHVFLHGLYQADTPPVTERGVRVGAIPVRFSESAGYPPPHEMRKWGWRSACRQNHYFSHRKYWYAWRRSPFFFVKKNPSCQQDSRFYQEIPEFVRLFVLWNGKGRSNKLSQRMLVLGSLAWELIVWRLWRKTSKGF